MNLTELKERLRSMEDYISEFQIKIEKMKPQPEGERKEDFDRITRLAKRYPLENRVVGKGDPLIQKVYISCLSYIMIADEENLYHKLLYLCRLAQGLGADYASEDILKMGMEFDQGHFENSCEQLKEQKHPFLTDALILANITGETAKATFALIADLGEVLKCDKEEIRVAANVAKAVLLNDMELLHNIPAPFAKQWIRQFIPASWIESQRKYCGKYCSNIMSSDWFELKTDVLPCEVSKSLEAGTFVSYMDELVCGEQIVEPNGYQIADYINSRDDIPVTMRYASSQKPRGSKKTISISAPCEGIVFFAKETEKNKEKGITFDGEMDIYITKEYTSVYVCSYFDNYEDFRKWHEKIRGGNT